MVTTPTPIVGAAAPAKKAPKQLPPPNSDFYEFAETLNAEELAVLKQGRAFMETKGAPIINKYWIEDSFPFEVTAGVQGAEHRRTGYAGRRGPRGKTPAGGP